MQKSIVLDPTRILGGLEAAEGRNMTGIKRPASFEQPPTLAPTLLQATLQQPTAPEPKPQPSATSAPTKTA